jgi:hypothetical protein
VSICFSHMDWIEDALVVRFAHQKNDQEGVRSQEPRHVFPNPLMPAVCAVLALAIYLLCTGFEPGQKQLFSGSSQYDRYSRTLQRVLQVPRIATHLTAIGKPAGAFGTHSVRKGAATYCCSGSTAAPPISAVRIRVGWVTPGVEDTYIRFEAAGDQFVGRTVAGHDLNTSTLASCRRFFQWLLAATLLTAPSTSAFGERLRACAASSSSASPQFYITRSTFSERSSQAIDF